MAHICATSIYRCSKYWWFTEPWCFHVFSIEICLHSSRITNIRQLLHPVIIPLFIAFHSYQSSPFGRPFGASHAPLEPFDPPLALDPFEAWRVMARLTTWHDRRGKKYCQDDGTTKGALHPSGIPRQRIGSLKSVHWKSLVATQTLGVFGGCLLVKEPAQSCSKHKWRVKCWSSSIELHLDMSSLEISLWHVAQRTGSRPARAKAGSDRTALSDGTVKWSQAAMDTTNSIMLRLSIQCIYM
jgi:hypothetical protein